MQSFVKFPERNALELRTDSLLDLTRRVLRIRQTFHFVLEQALVHWIPAVLALQKLHRFGQTLEKFGVAGVKRAE